VTDGSTLGIHVADADELPAALTLLHTHDAAAAASYAESFRPDEFVLVAYRDGAPSPVGVVFGRRPTPTRTAILQYLVVDSGRYRERIGEALVERFCDESRERGALQATLHYGHVLPGSERGRELTAFYTHCGFERAGSYMMRRVDGPQRC
jgi:GNAT superfamily N-acetyltransferase